MRLQTLHRAVSHHRRDEAYMARMCHEGWATARLVEGFWTFEPCRPDQYVCRVCYLRGKSGAEVEALRRALAAQGIEFVSRYSFWAVFCALALAVSKVSAWFCLPGALVGLYALMCTALGISYTA